ncbi:MAG TPA: hypothetical protein PKM88_06645 [bacterium]|nr:hypothetical protein [bacterium]
MTKDKYADWLAARKRYRLSDTHVQMARELGLNPEKFGKIANHRQETWKIALPDFIAQCYRKQFGKDRPDCVKSLEELARYAAQKLAAKRERKQLRRAAESTVATSSMPLQCGKGCGEEAP